MDRVTVPAALQAEMRQVRPRCEVQLVRPRRLWRWRQRSRQCPNLADVCFRLGCVVHGETSVGFYCSDHAELLAQAMKQRAPRFDCGGRATIARLRL